MPPEVERANGGLARAEMDDLFGDLPSPAGLDLDRFASLSAMASVPTPFTVSGGLPDASEIDTALEEAEHLLGVVGRLRASRSGGPGAAGGTRASRRAAPGAQDEGAAPAERDDFVEGFLEGNGGDGYRFGGDRGPADAQERGAPASRAVPASPAVRAGGGGSQGDARRAFCAEQVSEGGRRSFAPEHQPSSPSRHAASSGHAAQTPQRASPGAGRHLAEAAAAPSQQRQQQQQPLASHPMDLAEQVRSLRIECREQSLEVVRLRARLSQREAMSAAAEEDAAAAVEARDRTIADLQTLLASGAGLGTESEATRGARRDQAAELQAALAASEGNRARAEARAEALEARLSRAAARARDGMATWDRVRGQLRKEVDVLRAELVSREAEAADLREENAVLRAKVALLESDEASGVGGAGTGAGASSRSGGAAASAQETAALRARLEERESRCRRYKEAVRELKRRLEQARRDADEAKARLDERRRGRDGKGGAGEEEEDDEDVDVGDEEEEDLRIVPAKERGGARARRDAAAAAPFVSANRGAGRGAPLDASDDGWEDDEEAAWREDGATDARRRARAGNAFGGSGDGNAVGRRAVSERRGGPAEVGRQSSAPASPARGARARSDAHRGVTLAAPAHAQHRYAQAPAQEPAPQAPASVPARRSPEAYGARRADRSRGAPRAVSASRALVPVEDDYDGAVRDYADDDEPTELHEEAAEPDEEAMYAGDVLGSAAQATAALGRGHPLAVSTRRAEVPVDLGVSLLSPVSSVDLPRRSQPLDRESATVLRLAARRAADAEREAQAARACARQAEARAIALQRRLQSRDEDAERAARRDDAIAAARRTVQAAQGAQAARQGPPQEAARAATAPTAAAAAASHAPDAAGEAAREGGAAQGAQGAALAPPAANAAPSPTPAARAATQKARESAMAEADRRFQRLQELIDRVGAKRRDGPGEAPRAAAQGSEELIPSGRALQSQPQAAVA